MAKGLGTAGQTDTDGPGLYPQCNFGASAAPGTGNDNTEGYAIGSQWLDTTLDDAYICLNAATGAAVWKKTTP